MKLKIRVANPASGNITYIARDAAARYVARGRARWKNERTIVFLDIAPHISAQQSATLATQPGYDRVGRMTTKQIAGIPVINPGQLLTIR